MGAKEQVERVLRRQGAARMRGPASAGGAFDGAVAEGPGGVALVRRAPAATSEVPAGVGRQRLALTCDLEMAADLLIEAGFQVARAADERGPYLRVGH